jgi:hypothetical protein
MPQRHAAGWKRRQAVHPRTAPAPVGLDRESRATTSIRSSAAPGLWRSRTAPSGVALAPSTSTALRQSARVSWTISGLRSTSASSTRAGGDRWGRYGVAPSCAALPARRRSGGQRPAATGPSAAGWRPHPTDPAPAGEGLTGRERWSAQAARERRSARPGAGRTRPRQPLLVPLCCSR